MNKYLLIILCVIVISTRNVFSHELDGESNLTVLDMHTGLPHNFVNDIYEDSRGFIWIATYGGGLTRYDGYGFMNLGFGTRSLNLRSNSCRTLVEDKFNRLWVSFDEGTDIIDLDTYQKAQVKCKTADLSKILNEPSVFVYLDSKDNIWLLTRTHIYRFVFDEMGNIAEIATTMYSSNTPEVHIYDANSDGSVWMSSDGKLKRFVAQNSKLVKSSLSRTLDVLDNVYITDFLNFGGDTWITTNVGLFRYTPATDMIRHYIKGEGPQSLTNSYTTCLARSSDNKLLVGTLGGVNIYDAAKDSFTPWDTSCMPSPHMGDFVHCMFVRPGVVWVGTETMGIFRFSARQMKIRNFVNTSDPGSLSPNCVNAMYVEPDGTLWAGTVDGGLNRRPVGSDTFQHFNTSNSRLSHNSVSTLEADANRRLWVGSWGGGVDVVMMDNPKEIYHLDVGEKYNKLLNYIGAFAFDSRNNGLWIGSNDGMFFYDFDRKQLLLPFERCLDVRGCIGSLVDSRGRLWMGSQTGLRIIDLNHRNNKGKYPFVCTNYMYKLDQPDSKVVDKITCFCETADGTIWIGSNNYGIYRAVQDEKEEWHFQCLTTENGLANNCVKGIACDISGNLWITTNCGLSVYNPADDTFTNFDSSDGLVSATFYWNSALAAGKTVYLGTDKGLSEVFGLNHITRGNDKLTFTSLAIGNQAVYAGSDYLDKDISVASQINMHESDKSFAISFSALQYNQEAKGLYYYRLRGFDRDWVKMRLGEHSVRYTNLPSGKFTLEVKYVSAISGNVLNTASIDIRVTPYFWKSWWFMLIVVAVVSVVAVYVYRRRLETIRERETMRLLTPIKEALEDSDDPMVTQTRIRNILDSQKRFKETIAKVAEEEKQYDKQHAMPFMERLLNVMKKNYMDSNFDGDRLADGVGMSRSLLVKKVKAETGQTVTQFIKDYRLNMAREMLSQNEGNLNITEIAYRVGFNDPKYFTRCFSQKYGTSPSNFVDSMTK